MDSAGGALLPFAFRGAGPVCLDDHLPQQVERSRPAQRILLRDPPHGDMICHVGREVQAQLCGLAGTRRLDLPLLHRGVQAGMAVFEVECGGELGSGDDRGAAQEPCQLQTDELGHRRGAAAADDHLPLREDFQHVVVLDVVLLGKLADQGERGRLGEAAQLVDGAQLLRDLARRILHVLHARTDH
ncbi:hypothetical protein [Tessaracoccus sp. Z1128]